MTGAAFEARGHDGRTVYFWRCDDCGVINAGAPVRTREPMHEYGYDTPAEAVRMLSPDHVCSTPPPFP